MARSEYPLHTTMPLGRQQSDGNSKHRQESQSASSCATSVNIPRPTILLLHKNLKTKFVPLNTTFSCSKAKNVCFRTASVLYGGVSNALHMGGIHSSLPIFTIFVVQPLLWGVGEAIQSVSNYCQPQNQLKNAQLPMVS